MLIQKAFLLLLGISMLSGFALAGAMSLKVTAQTIIERTPTATQTATRITPDAKTTAAATSMTSRTAITIPSDIDLWFLHAEPSTESAVVEAAIRGKPLTVLSEPHVANGETWWHVQSPTGTQGWVLLSSDTGDLPMALSESNPGSDASRRTVVTDEIRAFQYTKQRG